MAEGGGGGEFGYKAPELDYAIDNDKDDEQEVNRTQPFEPTRASTPYFDWSKYEMQPMQEQSGLPDPSYEETPLLSGSIRDADIERRLAALREDPLTGIINTTQMMDASINPLSEEDRAKQIERVKRLIKAQYPNANLNSLVIRFSTKKPMDIVVVGSKGGETKIVLNDGSGLQKSFLNLTYVKKALGPEAPQIIEEDRNTAAQQLQRLKESENQLMRTEKISSERKEEEQKMQDLKVKIEKNNARIDAIQEVEGSNLESEAELRRLKLLNKNHQTELEKTKKELDAREKKAKKEQKKMKEKVDQERKKLNEIERRKKNTEERFYEIKRLDELKERANDLNRQNEEDQALIQDENTTPTEREAAEARRAERNEEIARIQTQIDEREAAMPLRERVREIFKKYGVTVTAIFLAAGITIGAVVGAITNALKSMGNQLANGLKDVGAKAASALPGLIGAIVSFLFKTAGQAIGYLAEYTWLLILSLRSKRFCAVQEQKNYRAMNGGEGRKETLADKPLDFENRPHTNRDVMLS